MTERSIRFASLDGYDLGGTLFEPSDAGEPRTTVVFACGGGSPSWHYKGLCRYVATHGIPVLLFDYRGIGLSRPKRMRGFVAEFEVWGTKDAAAAIAWLQREYPHAQLTGIAHSIGPMILATAPNASAVRRFVFLGPHTGHWRDYLPGLRIPMLVFWHYVVPLMALLVGYFPGSALGLGSDFPKQFALQWHARVRRGYEHLIPDPERLRVFLERLAGTRGSALVIAATDDAFGNQRGATTMLELFRELGSEIQNPSPRDLGERRLGHFGYFRRERACDLWPQIVAYLSAGESDSDKAHKGLAKECPGRPAPKSLRAAASPAGRPDETRNSTTGGRVSATRDRLCASLDAIEYAFTNGVSIEPGLVEFARQFDFDHVTYVVAASPSPGYAPRSYIVTTLPDEDWFTLYAKSAFVEVDPRVVRTQQIGAPFIWDFDSERGQNARTDRFLDTARLVGICSGVVIPLASTMTPRAMLGVHGSRQYLRQSDRDRIVQMLPEMTQFARAFHEMFVRLHVAKGMPSRLRGRMLTLHEQGCVTLAARGLSNEQIAKRLVIPAIAVDFHFDALHAKLDAIDRADAVVRARLAGFA